MEESKRNIEKKLHNLFKDIEIARDEAKRAYSFTIGERHYQVDTTIWKRKSKKTDSKKEHKVAKRDGSIEKRYERSLLNRLAKLKTAILDLNNDLHFELREASEQIGLNVDVDTLPISENEKKRLRHALGGQGLIETIDRATTNLKRKRGSAKLAPFHAAAPYLLEHYKMVHGEVTATVEEISPLNEKQGDITIIDKEGYERVKRYSGAINFLHDELRRMAPQSAINHNSAKTIIEEWIKEEKLKRDRLKTKPK